MCVLVYLMKLSDTLATGLPAVRGSSAPHELHVSSPSRQARFSDGTPNTCAAGAVAIMATQTCHPLRLL